MIVALIIASVSSQAPGFRPLTPPVKQECWTAPLNLSLADLAAFGQVASQVAKNHCLAQNDLGRMPMRRTSYLAGQTKLSRFHLFGEEFGFNLNVVVQPGALGAPDTIYAAPGLDLPESWDLAIDKATYPVLIIGGAAITTSVLLQLLK